MGRTPLWRDSIAFQTASRPTPIGETMPTPVITTSRSATLLPGQSDNAGEGTKNYHGLAPGTEAKRMRQGEGETGRDARSLPDSWSPCLLARLPPCSPCLRGLVLSKYKSNCL